MATPDVPQLFVNSVLQADDQITNTERVLQHIIRARRAGEVKIDLPINDIIPLSIRGIDVLKSLAGEFTNTSFDCIYNTDGSVSFCAVAHMPAAASNDDVAPTKKDGEKVKRPKNAFVIYRLHHHEKVRAANPGLHNNAISKIIGSMWGSEPQSVKDEYKMLAEDEKRQHAIDHPGYQYQPRKPSEKKKRMTKNKLAKLAARSGNTNAPTDATSLPAIEQIAVDTLMPPYQNNTSQITTLSGVPAATFNVVPDAAGDDALRDQLDMFNAQQPQLQATEGLCAPPAAFGTVPLLQGEQAFAHPSEVGFSTYDAVPFAAEWSSDMAEQNLPSDPYAEQSRQQQLEEELGLYFNFGDASVPDDFDPTQFLTQ